MRSALVPLGCGSTCWSMRRRPPQAARNGRRSSPESDRGGTPGGLAAGDSGPDPRPTPPFPVLLRGTWAEAASCKSGCQVRSGLGQLALLGFWGMFRGEGARLHLRDRVRRLVYCPRYGVVLVDIVNIKSSFHLWLVWKPEHRVAEHDLVLTLQRRFPRLSRSTALHADFLRIRLRRCGF